jgi:hypothetical protein
MVINRSMGDSKITAITEKPIPAWRMAQESCLPGALRESLAAKQVGAYLLLGNCSLLL